MLEMYVEKYMPLKIQSSISGTVQAVIPERKSFVKQYAEKKMKSLKDEMKDRFHSEIDQKVEKLLVASKSKNKAQKPKVVETLEILDLFNQGDTEVFGARKAM